MSTFLFAGNGPYSNRGCEAIVRGTAILLREAFGDSKFYSAYNARPGCRDREREADPGVVHVPYPLFPPFSLERLIRAAAHRVAPLQAHYVTLRYLAPIIRHTRAVLMLGGDNYSLDYGIPHFVFALNRFALAQHKPVILWGASIGPFSADLRFERWATRELRRVNRIIVRESASQRYLLSLGLEENVRLMADPAFLLPPESVSLPSDIETMVAGGCVGLNLSPLLARYRRARMLSEWTDVAAALIRALVTRISLPVLLIPHVTAPYLDLWNDDFLFLRAVRERAGLDAKRVGLLGPDYNAGQTKYIIGRLVAFAGARTHSTIAAFSSAVPTLCIAYSQKAIGIAGDLYGCADWLVDVRDLTPDAFAERFASLLRQETQVRAFLRAAVPHHQHRARQGAAELATLLSADASREPCSPRQSA